MSRRLLSYSRYGDRTYDEGRQWGSQVLNYDGPPSREAAGVVMPGVIQIGESLREREFAPGCPNALAFAGFVGATSVESGRVDAPHALRPGEPAVLIYRYSHAEQSATLWLNGRRVASTRAIAPVAIVSRKIIGRHAWKDLHFAGDLAELRIYNEALGTDEIARLWRDLGREHGVTELTGGTRVNRQPRSRECGVDGLARRLSSFVLGVLRCSVRRCRRSVPSRRRYLVAPGA